MIAVNINVKAVAVRNVKVLVLVAQDAATHVVLHVLIHARHVLQHAHLDAHRSVRAVVVVLDAIIRVIHRVYMLVVLIALLHAMGHVQRAVQHVNLTVHHPALEDVVQNAMDVLHLVPDSAEMAVVTDAWDSVLDVANHALRNVVDVLEIVVHHAQYTAV